MGPLGCPISAQSMAEPEQIDPEEESQEAPEENSASPGATAAGKAKKSKKKKKEKKGQLDDAWHKLGLNFSVELSIYHRAIF